MQCGSNTALLGSIVYQLTAHPAGLGTVARRQIPGEHELLSAIRRPKTTTCDKIFPIRGNISGREESHCRFLICGRCTDSEANICHQPPRDDTIHRTTDDATVRRRDNVGAGSPSIVPGVY